MKQTSSPGHTYKYRQRNNWWLNITQSLYPPHCFHRPNSGNLVVVRARKNPQADRISDRRLFYLFNTMNLFVLRALNLWKERFLIFFCCFSSFVCALLFFSFWCLQPPVESKNLCLSSRSTARETHAYKNSWFGERRKSLQQKNVDQRKGEKRKKSKKGRAASKAKSRRRCYYIKLTTKHIYVCWHTREQV